VNLRLWGSKTGHRRLTCGFACRAGCAAGSIAGSWRHGCSIWSSSASPAGWPWSHAPRPRRMPSCWSSARKWRCCGGQTRNRSWSRPTGQCSQPWPGSSPEVLLPPPTRRPKWSSLTCSLHP